MNLYQRLGYLVLGSRLRRLSESFISEIVRAYQQQGIAFEAAWFPVFYLLSERKQLSIKELSEETEVSHPAASQLIATLKKKGLVRVATSVQDGRKQLVALSPAGEKLLEQIKPVWAAIAAAMARMTAGEEDTAHLWNALTALEKTFQEYTLSELITKELNHD
ncbi:MarR family winged helix-turn-helix transcriptional regulator [Mucilaginibacter sp. AW1-3]